MNLKQNLKNARRIYRHRIDIFRVISDTRSLNEKISLEKVISVQANVKNLHGKEYFLAKNTEFEDVVTFNIRFIPTLDIDIDMVILYRGNYYNVIDVNNILELDRYIELKTQKVKGDKWAEISENL